MPELEEYRTGENLVSLEFGMKIGAKSLEGFDRWVEQWAKFEVGKRDRGAGDNNTTIETSYQSIEEEEIKEGEA